MNKKLIITGIVVVLVLGAGVAALAFNNNQQTNSTPSNQVTSSPPQIQDNTPGDEQSPTGGKSVTVSGKMTCLSPKDTSGPVNTSCAIGLEGDDGKNYSLNADDPTLTGSVPTGQRVQVTGSLTEQTSQYDAVGVIRVDSLQRL